MPPLEFRRRLREQAIAAGAELTLATVQGIAGQEDDFTVTLDDGRVFGARRIVLAYGLRNDLPDIPGFSEFYGLTVFHCPDCDGPSVAGLRLGVLGNDRAAAASALFLLSWTDKLTLLTHGSEAKLETEHKERLAQFHIDIHSAGITRLTGENGRLNGVELEDGQRIPLDALFFHYGTEPACDLAQELGCECEGRTTLVLDSSQETTTPGIYGAGDLDGPPYLTISAAAGGCRVAMSIHRSLLPPDYFL